MKGIFKTFKVKGELNFAAIYGTEVYISDQPFIILAESATMEVAAEIFPKQVLDRLDIVDVEYQVKL